MDGHGTGPEPLTPVQCLDRLRTGGVGRIAFSRQALPAIVSVSYTVVTGGVVFELTQGSAELLAMRNAVVAFQADQGAGPDARAWSVTCVGRARPIEEPAEVSAIATLYEWPSVSRGESAFLRLDSELLQGVSWRRPPAAPVARLTTAPRPAS